MPVNESSRSPVTPQLVARILESYRLPAWGTHGLSHWARVLENGRRIAAMSGADPEIVELFAVLHDSRRQNEGWDLGHGRRGADLAADLRGVFFNLDEARFHLLRTAIAGHTNGKTRADPTVQACWDADRLDLGRVGYQVDPRRLCTDAARQPEVLTWAVKRAETRFIPGLIQIEWNISHP